jgi:prevent-host-death family protein
VRTITAADANRRLSKLLREVSTREVFTILSRGKPVAIIGPTPGDASARDAAKEALLTRLRAQRPIGTRDWARDELYER